LTDEIRFAAPHFPNRLAGCLIGAAAKAIHSRTARTGNQEEK
jgi:hypothetical protein